MGRCPVPGTREQSGPRSSGSAGRARASAKCLALMSSSQRAGLPHSPSARQVHFREHLLPTIPRGAREAIAASVPTSRLSPITLQCLPNGASSLTVRARAFRAPRHLPQSGEVIRLVRPILMERPMNGRWLVTSKKTVLTETRTSCAADQRSWWRLGHQLSETGQIVALTAGVSCLEPLHPGHSARPYKAVGCNCYIALSSTTTFRRDLSSSSYADPLHAINRVPVIAAPTGPTNRRRASIESSSDLTKCLCQRDLATIGREWW